MNTTRTATYFWSGSNRPGEIRALAKHGQHIGVAVDALDRAGRAIAVLCELGSKPERRIVVNVAQARGGKPILMFNRTRVAHSELPAGDTMKPTIKEINARAAELAKSRGIKITAAKAELALELSAAVDFAGVEHTVISYGGGVDSTAIVLRLLEEGFEAHGIDPTRLLVIMAQTGNEYPDLADLVEAHVLPRLAAAGVRFVQVARQNSSIETAFTVLDDSTTPSKLYIEGDYQLRDEMLAAGTIPQSGGARLCSIKSKGWPLDSFVARELDGAPFRHIIGFECEELGRVLKDVVAGNDSRRPSYPLVAWGWNRAKCLDYIESVTGARWVKSACYFCPFAGQGSEKTNLVERWANFPELAADTLVMEYTAQALNQTQTLFGGRKKNKAGELGTWDQNSAIRFATKAELSGVLAAYQNRLDSSAWAVYRVRRLWTGNSTASRSTEIVFKGSRSMAAQELGGIAYDRGVAVSFESPGHEIARVVCSAKGDSFPNTEELFVVAPLTANAKTASNFETRFAAAPAGRPSLSVLNCAAECG